MSIVQADFSLMDLSFFVETLSITNLNGPSLGQISYTE